MITVSPARPEDHAAWRELFAGYAAFYEVELDDAAYDRAWSWIHDPARSTHCLLARTEDGTPIGLAHYRAEDSPLRGTRGFLDDLFVAPEHRGGGAVDALFAELRRVTEEAGWPSLSWRTAENNYRARAVYDRYAAPSGFLTYAM
ncbi:N-acetyltransferase family protein [Actinomycetota bacterium Odt1-20B]